MMKKGTYPHKFREGQVVYWGNGADVFVRIVSREPLHCDGGCPGYRVHWASKSHCDALGSHYAPLLCREVISEEVLRALRKEEI